MKFYRCLICGDPYMGSGKPEQLSVLRRFGRIPGDGRGLG